MEVGAEGSWTWNDGAGGGLLPEFLVGLWFWGLKEAALGELWDLWDTASACSSFGDAGNVNPIPELLDEDESLSAVREPWRLEGEVSECHLLPRLGECSWEGELEEAWRLGEEENSSEFFTLGSFTTCT